MSTEDQSNTELQESGRRNFIRNSALAAGSVAALSVAAGASAQDREFYEKATVRSKKLTATFDSKYQTKITREDVFAVVDQLLDIAGCPTCGLNGFDLNLEVNPVFESKIDIPVNIGVGV